MNLSACKNGRWRPLSETSISLSDVGFLQGVVIVDRLRTVEQRPLDVAEHIDRFHAGCQAVGIQLPAAWRLDRIVQECVERHRSEFPGRDFSIVLLATPGANSSSDTAEPTLIVHPLPIPWSRLSEWYLRGQPLTRSAHRNVPSACWSPRIKTRARLQYYLADLEAAQRFRQSPHSELGYGSRGELVPAALLEDVDGYITETSMANVCIVEGNRLVSPPKGAVLEGISLQRTLRVAEHSGIEVRCEAITMARAEAADELLLSGSTGCLWPAGCLNERRWSPPDHLPVYQQLCRAWREDIGLDFVQQAFELAGREPERNV